jgi:hypothetical protein
MNAWTPQREAEIREWCANLGKGERVGSFEAATDMLAELDRLRGELADARVAPSRFCATPAEVHAFLAERLAEDTHLRYQQVIGGRAASEAARDLRSDANLRQLEGEVEDAAETRALADLIDPLKHGGPYPSSLIRFGETGGQS